MIVSAEGSGAGSIHRHQSPPFNATQPSFCVTKITRVCNHRGLFNEEKRATSYPRKTTPKNTMYIDPLYLVIMLGTTALAMLASWRVKGAYARYSQVPARSGLTGAQIAQRILDLNNIHDVEVVPTHGLLSDHYDPTDKKLVLCEENYYGTNVAALGVAAHEAGHAIQHKQLYAPLQWRMAAVGITTLAGQAIPFIGFGLFYIAPKLALPALALCFGIVMLFQLITLPVEFDATARAKRILAHTGAVAPGEETESMGKVLDAAALTYVAAFISSLATFLYYVMHMLGGRREE